MSADMTGHCVSSFPKVYTHMNGTMHHAGSHMLTENVTTSVSSQNVLLRAAFAKLVPLHNRRRSTIGASRYPSSRFLAPVPRCIVSFACIRTFPSFSSSATHPALSTSQRLECQLNRTRAENKFERCQMPKLGART